MDFILNGSRVTVETGAFDTAVLDFLRELEITAATKDDGSHPGEIGVSSAKG